MAKKLDDNDRDLLRFRPVIEFVEPDIEPQSPNPVLLEPEPAQLEDVLAERDKLKKFAQALIDVARAVQERADDRARNMEIKLDPVVDQDAVAAMRRKFPNAEIDHTKITYEQYRQCKDNIREHGMEVSKNATVRPEDVIAARATAATGVNQIGGFGTDDAKKGGLRPELNQKMFVIPPINVKEMQMDLICILVNFVWKSFIKPVFPPPISWALPDRLCDPGGGFELPGLFILGGPPPPLLTGETAVTLARKVLVGS